MTFRERMIIRLGGQVAATAAGPLVGGDRSPGQRSRRPLWSRLTRSYKAAMQDRTVADWLSAGGDLNQELKSQLSILRARAREAEQNSNIARRFLSLVETHIVGPDGFTLQVQGKNSSGELDATGNKLVEQDFARWCRRGVCEITGRLSLPGVSRTTVRATARDGEGLIRLHDIRPTKTNPWGFVVELLDSARLDHLLNDDLKNGNRIRMGVELSPAGRPVGYWLTTGERSGWVSRRDTHQRVDADDIIHWFDGDRPEQLRAATWMSSALLTIHQVDSYQESAIINARAGASKMGFYTQTDNGAGAQVLADDEDVSGDLLQDFSPGHMGLLPPGYGFEGFDPKYPHEGYNDFIKVNHRDIAVGLGVSYAALTGDLNDVNFSSTRAGTLEEREGWKVRQDSFSATALSRIYTRWLSAAVLNNRLDGVVSAETLERFSDHRWQGRRWTWVDPLKDIQATISAINAGLTSPQRVAAEMGVDVDEVLDQIAAYQQMLTEKNVSLPVVPAGKSAAPDTSPDTSPATPPNKASADDKAD